ncbi:MAG TPA: methyltransferase domain-containing protein [Pirellulales bacterium]|nr:methyltransferase domain-containing protein [Pirellulales bacterium]
MATSLHDIEPSGEPLPAYADQLQAFHTGFRRELEEIIQSLPLASGMRVLDVACGDGFYTELLARRVGPGGFVLGLDSSLSYLQRAETHRGAYLCASLDAMPLEPSSFDFVWCAQNLYSVPDPVRALSSLHRTLRPGGMLGVLENDTIHEVLFPWPGRLELAVRAAEYRSLCAETSRPSKFYVGRDLSRVLARAGFEPLALRSQVIDRATPLGSAEAFFVRGYLQRLVERVQPYLDETALAEFMNLAEEDSPNYLLDREHVTISWMNVLAIARRATAVSTEDKR